MTVQQLLYLERGPLFGIEGGSRRWVGRDELRCRGSTMIVRMRVRVRATMRVTMTSILWVGKGWRCSKRLQILVDDLRRRP
jgi:hypothetical protein